MSKTYTHEGTCLLYIKHKIMSMISIAIIVTGFEKRGHLEQNKKIVILKQTMRGARYSLYQVIISISCGVIVD
jgi:hypothetical protein